MRQRVFLIAAVLASGMLAGCGGGGGNSLSNPIAQPTVAPPQSLMLTGTNQIQSEYAYPAASPYPNEDVTTSISDNTTAYGQVDGVNFYKTIETQTGTNDQHTYTIQTGTSAAASGTAGISNIVVSQLVTQDDSNDSQSITYTTPLIVDQQPENSGATWTNTAALTSKESFADGSIDNRTQNADDSYTDNLVMLDGTNATLQVNSDGSASLTTPAGSPAIDYGCILSYGFGAPASGGTFTITIGYNPNPPYGTAFCGTPTPPVFTETAVAWFPPVSSTNPLYSDSTTVTKLASYPAGCNVPSALAATPGNDVERTVKSIDPLLGFVEETITDDYTASAGGAVCVTMGDEVLSYYDWQGSNTDGTHNFLTGNAIQETVTNQTLTLQSGVTAPLGARVAAALTPAAIAAAEANFGSAITLSKEKAAESMVRSLKSGNPVTNIVNTAHAPISFSAMRDAIKKGASPQ